MTSHAELHIRCQQHAGRLATARAAIQLAHLQDQKASSAIRTPLALETRPQQGRLRTAIGEGLAYHTRRSTTPYGQADGGRRSLSATSGPSSEINDASGWRNALREAEQSGERSQSDGPTPHTPRCRRILIRVATAGDVNPRPSSASSSDRSQAEPARRNGKPGHNDVTDLSDHVSRS